MNRPHMRQNFDRFTILVTTGRHRAGTGGSWLGSGYAGISGRNYLKDPQAPDALV